MRKNFDITISLERKDGAISVPDLKKKILKLADENGYNLLTTSIPDKKYELGDKVAVKLYPDSSIVYPATLLGYGDYKKDKEPNYVYCVYINNGKRLFVDSFSNIYPYEEYLVYEKKKTNSQEGNEDMTSEEKDVLKKRVRELEKELEETKKELKDKGIILKALILKHKIKSLNISERDLRDFPYIEVNVSTADNYLIGGLIINFSTKTHIRDYHQCEEMAKMGCIIKYNRELRQHLLAIDTGEDIASVVRCPYCFEYLEKGE